MTEYKLIKHNIPYEYFCVERKYKGDVNTLITDKTSKKGTCRCGIQTNINKKMLFILKYIS